MTEKPAGVEAFRNHVLLAAGVAVVGLALAAGLPKTEAHRWSALWGAGLAAARWALAVGLVLA